MTYGAITLAALSILLSSAASAQQSSLKNSMVIHTFSHHTKKPASNWIHKDWNERNWGFAIRHELNTKWAIQYGHYKNSEHGDTVYFNVDYKLLDTPIPMGIFVALVSGYANVPAGAGLFVNLGNGRIEPRVRIIPPVGGHSGVVALELGVKF